MTYTDYLGNPIAPGDTVIYPVCSGSSSAQLVRAKIKDLIPLVEKPGTWVSTGPRSHAPLVRQDQEHKRDAAEYSPCMVWDSATRSYVTPLDKRYVLRVQEVLRSGDVADKTNFIKNVDRVVVITSLV